MTDPATLPESLEITLPGGSPLLLRRILPGEFRMGSRGEPCHEEPTHLVKIPQPFYFGTFPVTQAQYCSMATACLKELETLKRNRGVDPSQSKDESLPPELREILPVESVNWDEAIVISRWLSESDLLLPGLQAGLPSEAMWEYACRAGTSTEYLRGDVEAALAEVGWYCGNSGSETHPVGELPPNKWGFYDMHGNVWEWCADVLDAEAYRTCVDGGIAAEASNVAREAGDYRFRILRCGPSFFNARGASRRGASGAGPTPATGATASACACSLVRSHRGRSLRARSHDKEGRRSLGRGGGRSGPSELERPNVPAAQR